MICVRADPGGGGRSRILDVDAVRAEALQRLGEDMLKFRTEPARGSWRLSRRRSDWRPVLGARAFAGAATQSILL